MNWEQVAAVGQVLGSVAVLVTLVYLSIQTRHAQEAITRVISQSRMDALREQLRWGAEPHMAALHIKAAKNLDLPRSPFGTMLMEKCGLTREEAQSMVQFQMYAWQYRLQMISAVDALPPIERHQFDATLITTYGPGNRGLPQMFYEFQKANAPPVAVRYIENLLANAK
jgi:hypothetical protein